MRTQETPPRDPSPDQRPARSKRLPASLYAARHGNARRQLHQAGQVLLVLKLATFVFSAYAPKSSSPARSSPTHRLQRLSPALLRPSRVQGYYSTLFASKRLSP